MRTTPEECLELGRQIGRKLSAATGPIVLFVPLRGVSAIAVPGQVFHDAEADAALLRGLDETLSARDRACTTRHRHQRSGLRARDGRPTARADQGSAYDEGRGARASAGAARRRQPDHRCRRRNGALGEVRRGRRHRPHHHLQLGPLSHGGTRLAVGHDALRRRQRDRRGDGARGAAGRARDAGARGRLRHRSVPADAALPRRAQADRLQRRAELPDRRADRRHVPRRARGDRHGLRARGRHDPPRARPGPADRALRLRPGRGRGDGGGRRGRARAAHGADDRRHDRRRRPR